MICYIFLTDPTLELFLIIFGSSLMTLTDYLITLCGLIIFAELCEVIIGIGDLLTSYYYEEWCRLEVTDCLELITITGFIRLLYN